MANEDWPIVGVAVVADICKCPAGYITLDKTFDRTEEADLWRDGLFGRRVTRYLCVQRSAPQVGTDVLVDVTIINERDPVPAGFSVIDSTFDTREKATKKKCLCVRWMNPALTTSAMSELIFLPRSSRRPPNGYTLVGDLNNLMLCYKMSNIKTQSSISNHNSDPNLNSSEARSNLPYPINPKQTMSHNQGSSDPYSTNRHTSPPDRAMSMLSMNTVTPLSGVPWQLNPRLQDLSTMRNIQIPEIRYKSLMDIENQFQYEFNVEKAVRINSS